MEDFLELEDGEQLEYMDTDKEITMEGFLELEEWLDSEQKLDDERKPREKIWRLCQRLSSTDTNPMRSTNTHRISSIDLHPPNIERHPLLDEPHDCIVEMEPIEERMHKSEASHLVVHEHQRPPICAEEAVGVHKRVKRIHDHVKIVVPCAVFDVEFPIHPDKSVHLGSYS
ncbi:hypothetical protein HID58_087290, partial [Brassica napus]